MSDLLTAIYQYSHRSPLRHDTLCSIAGVLHNLNKALGPERAPQTPQYATLLRLLRAHTRPLPSRDTTFAQIQALRLERFARTHIERNKPFTPQLVRAIREGLVPNFPPETLKKLPPGLVPPHLQEESQIPWEERTLPLETRGVTSSRPPLLDKSFLIEQRNYALRRKMRLALNDIELILKKHYDGEEVLESRTVLLLEGRKRHMKLLGLQRKLRETVWNENLAAERDGRRGSKSRARVLKNLRKEWHKLERARIRQKEAEERERRKALAIYMAALNDHMAQFTQYHRDVVKRGIRFMVKAVTKYHDEVSRHADRAEREAERARIQKLREDDEEGYLELVKQTKNARLNELLEQTDKYLRELEAVVKKERAKSGVVEYEMKDDDRSVPAKRSYYEAAHAIKEKIEEQPRMLVGGTLKAYQLQGVQWMVSLYNNRLNGILADEMGLGKTIQTIALIAYLMEMKHNPGPYLIVVPLSTMSNWELEFSNWCPSVRTVTFKGDRKKRKKLYDTIIAPLHFNVCLATYEYVVRGKNLLRRTQWEYIIIDEGQRLKNHESKLSEVLSKQYQSRSRLLLTGTPLQNSLTELWALLNFLLPQVFNSSESFESWFAAPFANMGLGDNPGQEQSAHLTEEESLLIIRRLHQVLRPFLLRRLKADVLRSGERLPSKSEHVIMCDMSAWQKYIYYKIAKSQKILYSDNQGRMRYGTLPNPAMQLKKCCNHPYLFHATYSALSLDGSMLYRSSGKFELLDSVLEKLLRSKHRVLIFNQMKRVVELQERLLNYRKIPFLRLDGSTAPDDRKRMVAEFNAPESEVNVFLLTTRAGGLGVNLQTADTVIIFDSDWNPQMDLQAQDRAHRIGQRREVLVLRFLTAKSVEEMIIERATFKRGLEQKIIHAGMFDERSKDSERQALLRELLRIEEAESEGDDGDSNLPTNDEINQILSRSEAEMELFTRIDEERQIAQGSKSVLITEDEIPPCATVVPPELRVSGLRRRTKVGSSFEDFEEIRVPRRASQGISYGIDRLSDSQYIRMMENKARGQFSTLSDGIKSVQRVKRNKKLRRKVERTSAAIDNEFFGVGRDDNDIGPKQNMEIMPDKSLTEAVEDLMPTPLASSPEESPPREGEKLNSVSGNETENLPSTSRKRESDEPSVVDQPKRKKLRKIIDEESDNEVSDLDGVLRVPSGRAEDDLEANDTEYNNEGETEDVAEEEDGELEEEESEDESEEEEVKEEEEAQEYSRVEQTEEEEEVEDIVTREFREQDEQRIDASSSDRILLTDNFAGGDDDEGEIREDGELSDEGGYGATPEAFGRHEALENLIQDEAAKTTKSVADLDFNSLPRESHMGGMTEKEDEDQLEGEEEGEIIEEGEITDTVTGTSKRDEAVRILNDRQSLYDTSNGGPFNNLNMSGNETGLYSHLGNGSDGAQKNLYRDGLSHVKDYGMDEGEISEPIGRVPAGDSPVDGT